MTEQATCKQATVGRGGSNQEVFNTEIAPLQHSLYMYALSKTGNTEDARDLVQDTLMTAFRFMDHYTPGTNAKGWLFQIMKHLLINDYRKRQRMPVTVDIDTLSRKAKLIVHHRPEHLSAGEDVFDRCPARAMLLIAPWIAAIVG